eukprot:gene13034-27510_t
MLLHNAIRNEAIEEVKTLIASGSDVNEKDGMSRTPLHIAAWKGNSAIIKLLIQSKASTSEVAKDGFTALHFAVQSGDVDSCEVLIKKNKSLLGSRVSKGNKTALHLASAKNNVALVRLLIALGADITAQTNKRETAFDLTNSEDVKTVLLESLKVKTQSKAKKEMSPITSEADCKDVNDDSIEPVSIPIASSATKRRREENDDDEANNQSDDDDGLKPVQVGKTYSQLTFAPSPDDHFLEQE